MSDGFTRMVDRSGGPDSCWPWRGSTTKQGYGRVLHNGRLHSPHRIAWELANGTPLKKGLLILHSCDNPPCCNPSHLRPGTHYDNLEDMIRRGRGVSDRRARLTPEQVVAIFLDDRPGVLLAREYAVSPPTICHIKRGLSWPHLTKHLRRPH